MKKIIFSTMIASLLAFVGCQNEELVNDNNTDNSGKKVILTANIQGEADSRVALTYDENDEEYPVKVDWRNSGEKEVFQVACVSSNGFSAPTTFTQVEGSQFTGTIPSIPSDITPLGFCATYGGTMHESGWDYDLSQQDGTLNEEYVLMYAVMEGATLPTTIDFEHKTAILQPTFTGVEGEIEQIVMSGVENEISPINHATGKITIRPTDAQNGIYVFLTMPNDNNETYISNHTFTFTVTADDTNYTGSLTIPTGKSIEAGNLYTATIALTEVPVISYVWTSDIVASESESVEGEGTEASPYLIHSANDLQWMIDQVNTNGVTGKYFQLTHSLEIDSEEGATWTPIGTADKPFVGNFDGGCTSGYTISGEMHAGSTNLIGFFGYNAGTISNLKNAAEVKDCRTLMPASNDYSAIGSIAGYSTGKIIHCENSGNVIAPSIFTTTYTGGICGYQDNDETIALITECKNSGDVTGVAGDGNATGGIVGRSDGYMEDPYMPALIMACENAGSVTTGDKIGGICGLAEGPTAIVACLNTGDAGVCGIFGGDLNYDLNGCCTTKGYIYIKSNDVGDEGYISACYTFDVYYAGTDEYVNDSDSERVEEIVGPWNDPTNIGHDEMNYAIVQYNDWFPYNGCVCNWHWKVGENNIPKLVEGAPLGSILSPI